MEFPGDTDMTALPCTAQARVDTPLGPMRIARTATGLAGAWFDGQKHHPGAIDAPERPDDPLLARAAAALRAGCAGTAAHRPAPDLDFDLHGTPFQRAVWQALREIPPGRTVSYAQLAARVGRPAAVRAVGAAVGRNPVSVLVPCHRVVGSDGSLTGYAGGVERKQALLAIEAAQAARA
jgi:methylated-DNA-[protein]-cysteine S-methyltransferase